MKLSMAILAGMYSKGRTVVIKKEGRVMPIDHLVDPRPEKMEKPHLGKDPYIGPPLNGVPGDANTWWDRQCQSAVL